MSVNYSAQRHYPQLLLINFVTVLLIKYGMVHDCSSSDYLKEKLNKHIHINIHLEAFLSIIENISCWREVTVRWFLKIV